jgi:hypothetical protein
MRSDSSWLKKFGSVDTRCHGNHASIKVVVVDMTTPPPMKFEASLKKNIIVKKIVKQFYLIKNLKVELEVLFYLLT